MTLTEVLAPFGMTEDDFVSELSRELNVLPNPSSSGLTGAEELLLREHGGLSAPVRDEESVRKAMPQTASSNLAAQARESLSVEQAATVLMVDGSRVRHRVRDRALYAFKLGGALRLPTWQLHRDDAIPGLRAVLAALPPDLHPLEVSGFMTLAQQDLSVADKPTSPRQWLIEGGDTGAVVALVKHLDTW